MRKVINLLLAGAFLAVAFTASAATPTPRAVVVPVGPASISVVEIGKPPAR